MSQDLEGVLRASLDEADRYRKRTVCGSVILAVAVFAGLFWLDHLSRTADVKTILIFAVATLLVAQVTVAVATWGVITLAARKTLKAIELLARE